MILIVMIFMVESVTGLLSYVYQDMIEEDLSNSLEKTFIQLYDEDREVTKAVDQIQQEVQVFSYFSILLPFPVPVLWGEQFL